MTAIPHRPRLWPPLAILALALISSPANADRKRHVERSNGSQFIASVERRNGQAAREVEKHRVDGNTVSKQRYRGDGYFGRNVTRSNAAGQSVSYDHSGTRSVDHEAGTATSSRVYTGPKDQTATRGTKVTRTDTGASATRTTTGPQGHTVTHIHNRSYHDGAVSVERSRSGPHGSASTSATVTRDGSEP